ncbi:MAG: L,D-transpeptidase family protein [Pseudomonadota bacterium]
MFEHITVRRKPGAFNGGILCAGTRRLPCALGRSGVTVNKREGDGATPGHAVLRPRFGYWRADRLATRPACPLPMKPISADDGWCDAPDHACYNAPVTLPFDASHEAMCRDDELYNLCFVLDWNMVPRRSRARGSAIFVHVAKPGFTPTLGCIALALPDLVWLAAGLTPSTRITVLKQA